jgi:hypothetical protein
MASTPGPIRTVSPCEAAREAVGHTRLCLFPIRIETWLMLGFLAFLDQCGRTTSWGFTWRDHGRDRRGREAVDLFERATRTAEGRWSVEAADVAVHARSADSYFGWSFGIVVAAVVPLGVGVALAAAVAIAFAQGRLSAAAACCLGFIPIVTQTLFQPLFHFERAWSVFLLRQMGYELPLGSRFDGAATGR